MTFLFHLRLVVFLHQVHRTVLVFVFGPFAFLDAVDRIPLDIDGAHLYFIDYLAGEVSEGVLNVLPCKG
jgi:hypothetical protein